MVPPNVELKTGAPPGTLIYLGEERSERVKITLIEFDEHALIEKDFYDVDECMTYINPNMVKWINVDGIHDIKIIERIGQMFNIHPLTLEDIVHTEQRAKFEDYEHYVVSIMKMIYYEKELKSEQLSIVLMKNLVISFQEVHGGDAFDMVRNRIRHGKGRIRKFGADYLSYALLDAVIDCYFSILERIGDKIELLEAALTANPVPATLTELHHMKREMIFLRKALWPTRELINNIQRSETFLLEKSTEIYFRDLYDHSVRVIDTVETYRDLLSGMMDIYLSSTSNKMNEVMKVLTIISTIFIPVTFIAGIYGMNFEHMPELHNKWSYPILWVIMITIMLSLVMYFKRKKWL